MPGYANPEFRWGFRGRGQGLYGRGRFGGGGGGGGRGWRHRFYATGLPGWQRRGWWGAADYGEGPQSFYSHPQAPDREQELAALKNESKYLSKAMEEVKARMDELKAAEKKTEK
jgi:hypothetical protein